jgi:hypothetical protein
MFSKYIDPVIRVAVKRHPHQSYNRKGGGGRHFKSQAELSFMSEKYKF